jgi:hypothetical protein
MNGQRAYRSGEKNAASDQRASRSWTASEFRICCCRSDDAGN